MRPIAPVPHVCRAAGKPRSFLGRFIERLAEPFLPLFALTGILGMLLATKAFAATVVGVNVQTGSSPGAGQRIRPLGTAYFMVTQAERGTVTGVEEVHSMQEWAEKLGSVTITYGAGPKDAEAAFNEGADTIYVARVVGDAPTKGTKTLAATLVGAATIVLTAQEPGAWSANMDVEVAAGAIANTFSIFLYVNDDLIESYLDQATPALAVAAINARSELVTAVDSGNVQVAPGNNPAVLAAAAFSAGTDDRATIDAATYTDALTRFTADLGTGMVAIPGQTATNVGAALKAHAKAFRRDVALATAVAQSQAQAKAVAAALRGANDGAEGVALYWPWVKVPDNAGGYVTISPEGYIAGVRARTIRDYGIWQSWAGKWAAARWVAGTELDVAPTQAEVDGLARARVNPILVKTSQSGTSVRNYGVRSVSTDEVNFRNVTGRALLNLIAVQAEAAMEDFVHGTVDGRGHFFNDLRAELNGILAPLVDAGGLFPRAVNGIEVDPGYIVDTSEAVNTAASLAAGRVNANISVRMSPTAELITITVTKVAFDTALTAS